MSNLEEEHDTQSSEQAFKMEEVTNEKEDRIVELTTKIAAMEEEAKTQKETSGNES